MRWDHGEMTGGGVLREEEELVSDNSLESPRFSCGGSQRETRAEKPKVRWECEG